MESEKSSVYDKLTNKKCLEMFQKLDSMKGYIMLSIKSAQQSILSRREANLLYKMQIQHDSNMHKLIWAKYVQSIIEAPPGSHELALAYGGRANILLHMRFYRHCLKDVESALNITKSDQLKVWLLCYKARCSVALRLGIESNVLQKAIFFLNKIKRNIVKEDHKVIQELTAIVRKTTLFVDKCEDDLQRKLTKEKAHTTSSAVEIKYNKKYGRHLVATRDINPGEKVLVEKIYACMSDLGNAHCTHCLRISWSVIPCDYCKWVVFCSEKCKRKAWEKYHDMECHLLPYIFNSHKVNDTFLFMAIRITLMALKECGSIEELRKELNSVDDCIDDESTKSTMYIRFCSGSFKSVYSLSSNCPADIYKILEYESVIALYALAKYSEVLGKDFTFTNHRDLRKNKDAIFIGAVILKFSAIIAANAQILLGLDCDLNEETGLELCGKSRCIRGTYIAPLSSLINHSCNPNVYLLQIDNGKVLCYCVLPIKKNSQIFRCYYQPYSNASKSDRQRYLMENNIFKCNCEACVNNWHIIPKKELSQLLNEILFEKYKNDKIIGPIFQNLVVYLSFIYDFDHSRLMVNWKKVLRIIGKDMNILLKHVKFPSLEIVFFINCLGTCFERSYGPVPLMAPDACTKL